MLKWLYSSKYKYCHSYSVLETLGRAIEDLPHGLHTLKLANCKISARGESAYKDSIAQWLAGGVTMLCAFM